MKYLLISILSLIIISCKDDTILQIDNIYKRERIPFKNALPWIQRNAPQCKNNLYYMVNSKKELDSISMKFMTAEFLRNKFSSYDFEDSTLIGITFGQVHSSSSHVYIDSLILQRDSIRVYYHFRDIQIYQDVASLSDIVSLKKHKFPIVWVPNDTVYE